MRFVANVSRARISIIDAQVEGGFDYERDVGHILQNLRVPKEFDLLSLDIDQNTYYAWEGMSGFHPQSSW